MSKMCVFVVGYSLFLIALFITLCYLIININPPPIPESNNKYDDTDYFWNPNEAIPNVPNDDLRYGLEKVYDTFDEDPSLSSEINITVIPVNNNTDVATWLNETHVNCSKRQITPVLKPKDKPIKAAKDLRRSINEDNQLKQENESLRSLLIKIKAVDGQPGVKIKIVSDRIKGKQKSKYKNSVPKIKTTSNSSLKVNYFELDSDNSIREASIVMANNGTFILNVFANSIDVVRDNYTSRDKENVSDNNNHHEINTKNTNNEIFVTESTFSPDMESKNKIELPKIYMVSLIHNNFTITNISTTQSNTNKNDSTSTSSSKRNEYDSTIGQLLTQQEPSEQITLQDQNQTITQEKEDISLSTAAVVEETRAIVDLVTVLDEVTANTNLSNLVGLLMSEAAATLSVGD